MSYILPKRMAISEAGRAVLAGAVSLDRDWALASSAADTLIEFMGQLTDDDLEVAGLLAQSLAEAIGCVQIRRDMAAAKTSPADPVEKGESAQATAGSPHPAESIVSNPS